MKVGFLIGVFDVTHVGHVRLIRRAKSLVDRLIVAIVEDGAVRAQKGEGRPVYPFIERREIIEALKYVDTVVGSASFDPYEIFRNLQQSGERITLFCKGEDQDHVPTARIEKEFDVPIVTLRRTEGVSTTKTIEKLRQTS